MEQPVLLFDGVCNLCNYLVVFILRYENGNNIKFASLQSEAAAKLLKQYQVKLLEKELDTLVFIFEGKVFVRSDAALKIAGFMKKPISYVTVLKFLPLSLLNFLYDLVAKYRYRIFGRQAQCMVPEEKWDDRFLK